MPEGQRSLSVATGLVGDAYFQTMGIPLIRGRAFDAHDNGAAPKVVIINQAMADKYWPGADPIGKHIQVQGRTPVRLKSSELRGPRNTEISSSNHCRSCTRRSIKQLRLLCTFSSRRRVIRRHSSLPCAMPPARSIRTNRSTIFTRRRSWNSAPPVQTIYPEEDGGFVIEWRVWNTGWKAASHTSTSAGYTYTRMLAQPRVRVRLTRKLFTVGHDVVFGESQYAVDTQRDGISWPMS